MDSSWNPKNNREIVFAIRGLCNYHCHYCVGHHTKTEVAHYDTEKLKRFYESLDAFTVTSFECAYGEPTIHPQIREILEIITNKGMASLPSNNSIDPRLWLPEKNLSRIYLRAALHPQGETDITGFFSRLHTIKELGAKAFAIFVVHPTRMAKLRKYREIAANYGLTLSAVPFQGKYEGKLYPYTYTEEELHELGLGQDQKRAWWYHRLVPEMNIRDFSGIPCNAGYSSILIDENQKIRRCLYDTVPLDKALNGAAPCSVEKCGCGLLLEELSMQDIFFWNYWRQQAGLETINDEQNDTQDVLYERNSAKYWELMERYGKTGKGAACAACAGDAK